MKKRSIKTQNITRLLLTLAILVLLNVISSFLFTRFDLTSEKRYTLSPATIGLLKNLKDVVYVKVYLEGEFPPGFKRLRNATREMLDEMRVYANGNLEYEFIDPSESPDEKERNRVYNQLAGQGLQPTNLEQKEKEGSSQKIIFPGAIFSFAANQAPLQLLKDQMGKSPEQMLNSSIEGLEYEIGSTIRKITQNIPIQVGFIQGHGELDKISTVDMRRSLTGAYGVEEVTINQNIKALEIYRAIIIAKPDSAFDEKDKFIIDQFIMRGGKVLWLIDQMDVEMDSLKGTGETFAMGRSLNLDDMLFRYGARLNYDLVEDLQAAPIPVIKGYVGNQPQQALMPWYFFPLITPYGRHPIVNNLNAIRCEFAGTIDTVGTRDIRKTVLLSTSRYTKVVNAPVRVNLAIMRDKPDPAQFRQSYKTIALLLEGVFPSNFENRVVKLNEDQKEPRTRSIPNKMIVIADGDLIRNDVKKSNGSVYPLGYDKFTGEMFGNKNFLLNCMDYLCDDSGLITVRSKEIKLRMLDNTIIAENRMAIQWINTLGPILCILLFGIFKTWKRRQTFAR